MSNRTNMDTALIKKLLEAAKGLPVPFYFAILFFILLGLFGNDIPERYTALVYLVFIGALGAGTWWEIQRRRGDPRRGEVEPREKPVPALPPTRPGHSDPRAAYLAELPREWNRLRLLGLDRKAAEPGSETVQLDQVYTVLNTKTPRPEKLKKEDDRHTSEDPLSALEAFWHAGQHRVVLLGRPGSGKSTFVRHLCAELAAACRNPSAYPWKKRVPGWSGRQALLPVFVSLGRFAREVTGVAKPGVGSIERFICDALDRRDDLRGFGKNLLAEIGQHGGLVCFDGLDEVPSRLRTVVRDAVLAFADEYKQCHIVITSRTHTYKAKDDWQLAQWSTHELADFAPEQIQGFIKAWYTALAVVDTARGSAFYAKKAETLQQAVVPGAPRRLNDLAGNPLLLTIMTRVHTDQELPDSRVDVFDACVDTLLVHWSAVRSEGERSILDKLSELNIQHLELYAGLRRLAFEAIGVEADADDEGRALVTEGQIRAALHPRLKDEGVKAFLEYCRDANGLLLYEGEMRRPNAAPGEPLESYYTFPHSYFQEYLAARHLA
ncbi:MAG: NACHT domain-containing protein, partial [Gammaproteobacteria bacterium]|nr:NACHT domain-containing protein [Gammaproteobacteria bacterium]